MKVRSPKGLVLQKLFERRSARELPVVIGLPTRAVQGRDIWLCLDPLFSPGQMASCTERENPQNGTEKTR
jgi:hypothetical protein